MDAQQIKRFIDAMAASDLSEMEVGHDGWTLRLARQQAPARAPTARLPEVPASVTAEGAMPVQALPATPEPSADDIVAPMFGVVHLQQAPGEPPFVKVGELVEAGRMLCSIEAMKVFNELRAERAGRVAAVRVQSGSEVEAGQVLFNIERVSHV